MLKSDTFVSGAQITSWLEIDGLVPTNARFQSALLYDDDDRYLADDAPLYPSILGLPSPPLPVTSADNQRTTDFVEGIKSRFGLAYILPVDANALGWNAQRTIPFKRHAEPSLSGGLYDAGNQELNRFDRPDFWAYTVVCAYQRGLDDDSEPNNEALSLGLTVKKSPTSPNSYSVLFLETIRDRKFATVNPISFTLQNDRDVLRGEYVSVDL